MIKIASWLGLVQNAQCAECTSHLLSRVSRALHPNFYWRRKYKYKYKYIYKYNTNTNETVEQW